MTDHINRNPEARILGDELPPLPESEPFADGKVFTEEQLRDYALAAIAPYKARIAELEADALTRKRIMANMDANFEKVEAEVKRLQRELGECTGALEAYRHPIEAEQECERLRELLLHIRAWAINERIGTISYMEGSSIYNDLRKLFQKIDAALKEKP